MRYLPAAFVSLLLSMQVSADPLGFSIYRLTGGARDLLTQDRLEYTASDIEVMQWGNFEGEPSWKKSLALQDGFGIGLFTARTEPTAGFGLYIQDENHPDGFSWEWFHHDHGNVFKKLQGDGYVRVRFTHVEGGVEIQSIEFLTDVRLRFLDDIRRGPGVVSHEVVVTQGSVLRFPE